MKISKIRSQQLFCSPVGYPQPKNWVSSINTQKVDRKKIFLIAKIWDSGSQELFTESKYLALVLRTDSSKLGPTRAFFNIFPFLYRKIGLKKETFLTNLLSTFCMLMLETQFFGYGQPRGVQKNVGSGFLKFSFFPDFWARLYPETEKIAIFGHIMTQKSGKNEIFKNPLPTFFLRFSGLPIAKKLGFQHQHTKSGQEKQIIFNHENPGFSYTKPQKSARRTQL